MNIHPCPPPGQGVSDWIYTVGLKAATPAEAETIAIAAVRGYGGKYPLHKIRREIRRAFEYKGGHPDFREGATGDLPRSFRSELQDIRPDRAEILRLIKDGPPLGYLYDLSPFRDLDASCMLEVLFPGNPWLCCGYEKFRGDCKRKNDWKEWSFLQFIVPTPQMAATGLNTDGVESWHALSNCLDRRFIIVEFDSGSKDAQAAILWGMKKYGLAMVVDSAGKSLHGWFYCQGVREETVKKFFRYARSLCADPVHWTPSQFTRMPNGNRHGKEQVTYYFDPEVIK